MVKTFRDLLAWQLSMELVEQIYKMTASFPDHEKFGLVSQMRRSAISVPSNIAEGATRNSRKEYCQFLYIARGSLMELQTQLLISNRLSYILSPEPLINKTEKICALIQGLIRKQTPSPPAP